MCGTAARAERRGEEGRVSDGLLTGFKFLCVCERESHLVHTAEELPVKHGHLVGQILGAHQLEGGHGARRGPLLVG